MTARGSRQWRGMVVAFALLAGCSTPVPEITCDEICPGYVDSRLPHGFYAAQYDVLDGQALCRVRADRAECEFEVLNLTAATGEIFDPPEQPYLPSDERRGSWDAGTSSPVGEDLILVVEWTCRDLAFGATQILFPGDQLQFNAEVEGVRTALESEE